MRTFTVLICLLMSSLTARSQIATHVVISEVYGGGGNSGALYKNDFIELYNPTASAIDLSAWSVQYASATGSTWNVTNLSGTIPAYGFHLVREGSGGTVGTALPAPDDSGSIGLSATAGKVALVSSTALVTGLVPSSYVDLIGYGNATGYEGTRPAPAPSNIKSVERKAQSSSTAVTMAPGGGDERFGNGCDADDNADDFVVQSSINPQNSSSTIEKLTDSALPVTIRGQSASVKDGRVILTFSTASEVDLAGFNIRRASIVTGPFEIISSYVSNTGLRAAGNANAGAAYSFEDSKVAAGRTYYYSIEAVNISGKTEPAGELLELAVALPESFQAFQNFPNPFNPATSISFRLPDVSTVTLKVYDISGREVAVLVDGVQSAGIHNAIFNGARLSSGIYFCRLHAETSDGQRYVATRKMILVK